MTKRKKSIDQIWLLTKSEESFWLTSTGEQDLMNWTLLLNDDSDEFLKET